MKKKLKIKWHQFKLKVKICRNIFFKYEHFVVLNYKDEQLVRYFSDGKLIGDVDMSYMRLQEAVALKLLKETSALINDVDLACSYAEFEAAAYESYGKKENKDDNG